MTFNPKWHDQADELRARTANIYRLTRELQTLKRRRRADTIFAFGLTVTVIGLGLLWTEWFGTGILTAIVGFALAILGEEMGK